MGSLWSRELTRDLSFRKVSFLWGEGSWEDGGEGAAKDGMKYQGEDEQDIPGQKYKSECDQSNSVFQSWLSDPGRVTKVKSAHLRARLIWVAI